MSPSWPERSCAVLGPDQVQVVRRRRWRRGGVAAFAQPVAGDGGGPPWQGALDAFQRFLATPEAGAGRLEVVLSNHFVRYLLVPWSPRIGSAEELRNYAAALFEEVHGDASTGWDVSVSAERAGAPRLAAAVDRALLEGLRSAVAPTRLRLASVQPYLMAAYNRVARAQTGTDFVFMLLEAGRACVVAAQGGRWCHVGAAAAPEDEAALAGLLAREMQLAHLQGDMPPAYVHAAHRPGLVLPSVHGLAPRVLAARSLAGPAAVFGGNCELAASLV